MKKSIFSRTGPTSKATPVDISDLTKEAGPLTADPKLVILTCLLILASLTAAYVAAEILLPIILSFVLKLLFQPAMRKLERLRVPRPLAALTVILTLFGLIVVLGAAVSGPASSWAGRLPEGIERLQQRLHFLSKPLQTFQDFMHQIDGGQADAGFNLSAILLQGTQHFASGFFETILILFFLLISGDTFLRRTVEIIPRFSDKRQMVALSQQVEQDISAYLVTITLMNGFVGLATGTAMWATGLGDPILWGVLAFILNFVPILGPFAGVAIFVFVGLLGIDGTWTAFLPAGLYLLIHLIEGEIVTPMLLARRFTLNPVLVILSLIFWFWMWGVPGAILAVPMLAILKIICDEIAPLNSLGHFLEG
ncbi:AI-2E family transporter [Rhizobium mongolense]|uniref:PurR-regulated permease PerM n=2 Tax=Rhizobium mongolense TaxID=57676 RepID=A0ABR6IGD9_9HYPH|nr:AI-2E family transporter [Rhizobium mongolense]MBB4226921.1 putative PurR-regulated permease PerM [Rhizobium mongolense]TVZ74131.1 putative PurR-regulated permease PerM [Rhizobium mongolense USDA 1844]